MTWSCLVLFAPPGYLSVPEYDAKTKLVAVATAQAYLRQSVRSPDFIIHTSHIPHTYLTHTCTAQLPAPPPNHLQPCPTSTSERLSPASTNRGASVWQRASNRHGWKRRFLESWNRGTDPRSVSMNPTGVQGAYPGVANVSPRVRTTATTITPASQTVRPHRVVAHGHLAHYHSVPRRSARAVTHPHPALHER
jgi:hypothetical protein